MKILIYEGSSLFVKAMRDVLKGHDFTVVTDVMQKEGSEQWFGIDPDKNEMAIDPAQYELAFLDRQAVSGPALDSLEFATAMVKAGLRCVGMAAMPDFNDRIRPITGLAVAKTIVIAAFHSGRFTPGQFAATDDNFSSLITRFEWDVLHPQTPEMVALKKATEKFLQDEMKEVAI